MLLNKCLISECLRPISSPRLGAPPTSSVNRNATLNYGITGVVISKIHIKFTTISLKESSNEQKWKEAGDLSELGDVGDVRGIYIKRVIKLNSEDGRGIRRNNFVILVQKSICDGIGGIGFLMFWNWRNLGQPVLLSLLQKPKYDRNFPLVYKT